MKTSSMSNKKSRFSVLLAAAYLLIGLTESAHAYVDPGSGSVIVTTVLGFIAAISYTFRKTFYNLKQKFSAKSDAKLSGDNNND